MKRIGLIGAVIVATVVAVVVNLSMAQDGGGEGHIPFGACCYPDGSCSITPQNTCEVPGGVWHGEGSRCNAFDCTLVKVVSVTVHKDRTNGTEYRIFRAYSNGDVDMTWVDLGSECDEPLRCGPVSIIP